MENKPQKNSTFLKIGNFWKTLKKSHDFVKAKIAQHRLKHFHGFKLNQEEEFYSSINITDKIDSYTKLKTLKNAAARLVNVGAQTEVPSDRIKITSKINLIEESIDHVKGIPYSDEAKALYELLYIMKPSVVSLLNECGIAPHPDTVFNWIEKKENDLIYKVDDESSIPEIIHNRAFLLRVKF